MNSRVITRKVAAEEALSAEKARELLSFDEKAGDLHWRNPNTHGRRTKGTLAGWINQSDRYRVISIDGARYQAHRLVWLITFGRWPRGEIDHINGDRTDNRLENLRESTRRQNAANTAGWKRRAAPFKGLQQTPNGRWAVGIWMQNKRVYLGTFDTPEEAHDAFTEAARKLHGEFARDT